MFRSAPLKVSTVLAVLALGCASKDQPDDAQNSDAAGQGASTSAGPGSAAASTGAGGSFGGGHVQAAIDAATHDDACAAVAPFYWEIGGVDKTVVSGSTGDGSVTASTQMKIASGTKLLWGAYVIERFRDDPDLIDVDAMTMRSGYTAFSDCGATKTVAGCLALGENGDQDPAAVGRFHYGGGHYQRYGVELGLGPDTNAALASELGELLGADLDVGFWTPQIAAGIELSADRYALFLRKVLAGELGVASYLGKDATCTLPGTCPTADSSPVPEDWHYSHGHWVEDDAATGDGAFSSPGLFGFYPWIGASKNLYGIVARFDPVHALEKQVEETSYWKSVLCGRAIRKAFVDGAAP